MHLARVQIANFRTFVNFETTLSPGLNVIVGENNIEKTNLLDAIRLALGASSSTDPVRPTREDRHRTSDGSYADEPISITLTFASLSAGERAEFIDILDFNADDPSLSTAEVRYTWSWPDKAKRWTARRVAGGRSNSDSAVPDEVLQAMPITMLGALRDSVAALSPGRLSRLAQLLRATATEQQQTELEDAMKVANSALELNALITGAENRLAATLLNATGPMFSQAALVRTSEPQFDRIVTNLRLVLKERHLTPSGSPVVSELRTNGLGNNNLLYIATAIAELDAAKDSALPLLFVEEPEAHLHPQLQVLLADFLAQGATAESHKTRVQSVVTTHSPTLASHVHPHQIKVLHRSNGAVRCASLGACGLTEAESNQLRRMFDVTKATLLFGRGVMLVEGVTEALLIPALARRIDVSLAHTGISVVPLSGVDFSSIAKLFGVDKIATPVAIVTDADPIVRSRNREEFPFDEDGNSNECSRVTALRSAFASNTSVSVFASRVTLEYDLALQSDANALCIFDAWRACYERHPRTLTRNQLENAADTRMRAVMLWRALCRETPAHGKAELAQSLAAMLDEKMPNGSHKYHFAVPDYIQRAIRHALGSSANPSPEEA